jgi:hypothetical protein
MKAQNEKTFNCIAETKKGKFEVVIKVWEQITDGKTYFATRSWKSESYVIIEGQKLEVSFNQYDSTKVKSYAVAEKYGMKGEVSLMCDCSEVKNYISEIEMIRIRKNAEADKEIATSKMIHNL